MIEGHGIVLDVARKPWRRTRTASGAGRTLSWWWVGFYALAAVAVGAAVTWWAWPPVLTSPTDLATAEVEAIRTGLAATGGAGAVFTLLLAVRRQRATEEMDAATRHDAEQRRMTELYTVAVEQLGHAAAAVRLGALYALQRLGQGFPEQRRPIVNVWCAYLRMPFLEPDADGLDTGEAAALRQELEVRLTAQRLLREHAHSGPYEDKPASRRYWGDELDIDLTGATLHDLDLRECRVHPGTSFEKARFTGDSWFNHASFEGGETTFTRASFTGRHTWFEGATFKGGATSFHDATFDGATSFFGTTFTGAAFFADATFTRETWFDGATFVSTAWFSGATFDDSRPSFAGVVASCGEEHAWPEGWVLVPSSDVEASERESSDIDVTWGRLVLAEDVETNSEKFAGDATAESAGH
ncbi:pentapeptide repeat-containing protein [Saccharomonospora xinjiangensis]|uniref:pentapeptide repeat-containing protein n=1 Tax=Saccharomonospora xinjiangensis TaxID=75294 RepID=UPI001E3DAE8D|nr:pentapeptide repeat-containing protein [Saccharomonospora xinjiangensis]